MPFLALALALVQFETPPPSPAEIQARAAMDAASNARRRVLHALCGEDDRERRLRAADVEQGALHDAYRARFGRDWESQMDTSTRQWECTLPDGFEWTLASYHNALISIEAALAR